MNLRDIIKRPIITEKSLQLAGRHQYSFEVDSHATKFQIKSAVQKFFPVTVLGVRTVTVSGSIRRHRGKKSFFHTGNWKKAMVVLPAGQTIEVFSTEEEKKTNIKPKKNKVKKMKEREMLDKDKK